MMPSAYAYYPGGPGWWPYQPPRTNFYPGFPGSGWTTSPVSPRYFYPQRYPVNNWYRPFNFQRPWGKVNGAMGPDGSFWINFSFGGNYRDLQYLMTLMSLSANMQMGSGQTQTPVIPDDFSNGRDTIWPL